MSTPFLGQLMSVAFNFAPKGWALVNGQLLSISSNQALFALIGTFYGGNGSTNFQLPNLQGRAAVSSGQGPGLSNYNVGQTAGEENHTLIQNEIPTHTHNLTATATAGSLVSAAGNVLANSPMYTAATPNALMNAQVVQVAGGSQSHTNQQPFLVINWVIALQGIFPSRN